MHKQIEPADLSLILQHTAGLWQELRGQNLFITGGTGFFGHWLIESLLFANDHLDLNASVTILSRDPDAFAGSSPWLARQPAVTMLKGDIRTFDFPESNFPFVIHAAADPSWKLTRDDLQMTFDTILEGTRHLLEFAGQHGTQKLLFISSGAVYGRQPAELSHIPEDYTGGPDPLDVNSAYGEGKRAAELLCRLYLNRFGFSVKIVRCFAFVGPFLPLDAHFAIGNFIRDALHGGPIIVKGDGTPLRSYLYGADLAIWLWTILFRGENNQAYNVGSSEGVAIARLAEEVGQEISPGIQVKYETSKSRQPAGSNYVPATIKAEKELQLKLLTNRVDGIRKTIQWYKSVEE